MGFNSGFKGLKLKTTFRTHRCLQVYEWKY